MSRETGRLLWRIAYLIEAVCMLGLFSVARLPVGPGRFAGLDLAGWLWAGLAVGFSLWIVGSTALYWPRRQGRDLE